MFWPLSEVSFGAVLGVGLGYVLVVLATAVLGRLLSAVLLRPPAQASIAERVADVRRLPAPPA